MITKCHFQTDQTIASESQTNMFMPTDSHVQWVYFTTIEPNITLTELILKSVISVGNQKNRILRKIIKQ